VQMVPQAVVAVV